MPNEAIQTVDNLPSLEPKPCPSQTSLLSLSRKEVRNAAYTKTKHGDIVVYDARANIYSFQSEDNDDTTEVEEYK